MKKHLIAAGVSGVVLLAFAFGCLLLLPRLAPSLAEEYFGPIFSNDPSRNLLFFIQPFVLALGISWFWTRFKGSFRGIWMLNGLELGLVYVAMATLPAMMLIFSAISISLSTVLTWLVYGFLQATISGEIAARLDP